MKRTIADKIVERICDDGYQYTVGDKGSHVYNIPTGPSAVSIVIVVRDNSVQVQEYDGIRELYHDFSLSDPGLFTKARSKIDRVTEL